MPAILPDPDPDPDPDRYRAATTLPASAPAHVMDAAASRRRDLAIEGFLDITRALEAGDTAPLSRFYAAAVALLRPLIPARRRIWRDTVAHQTHRTAAVLDALEAANPHHLHEATLRHSPPNPTPTWGMRGHLRIPSP